MKLFTEDDLREAVADTEQHMMKSHGGFLSFLSAMLLGMTVITGHPYIHPVFGIVMFIMGLTFLGMGIVWKKR